MDRARTAPAPALDHTAAVTGFTRAVLASRSMPKQKRSAKRATKKSAAVRSVSPLRGMPIEQWIDAKTSGWQKEAVRRVIDVVRRAAPRASLSIKWAQPVFEQDGPFLFVKPAKAHVSVGFWRGAEVADPNGLLERGGRMGHFKLRSPDELDERVLARMVKDAVRLNREHGSPALRK
jgi:hypothetical protein